MNIVNENFDPRKISEFSEKDLEVVIRPKEFEDFSGQDKILENLKVFVKAAKMRGESLDHVLFHGPPGLGKTTLSYIKSTTSLDKSSRKYSVDRLICIVFGYVGKLYI